MSLFTKRITAVVTAGALLTAGMAQPAVAREQAGNVIEVVGTSAGFTMRDSNSAGQVTFTVSSSHPQGGLFALWTLRPTATLDDALPYAKMGLSDTRSESIAGGRGLQQRVEVLGGAAVLPGQPVSFTAQLRPGTYYLVNYQDFREGGVPQAAARLHTLTITNRYSPAPPPLAHATAVFTLANGKAAYWMPTQLRRGQPLRMINATPQLSEAVFMPVRPGTTQEQMRQFFAAADKEEWDVDVPFTGGPVGLPALSPNHTTIIQTALQPGLYALVTWYPDFRTGRMLAAEGKFELVTIV
ncbi:hypothetical protein JOF56_000767 [Kibdelosporangium banguiense]|uniref:Uncharacterized protein n=1 Tax=Kibdelosporangium banguiense TaxID=1365924 RepID=A0ABS4T7H9_9PSEU|nr:hypothetical protein [Kibdelosporangium banguiense]MBP2320382.1 hypothetical protein [Kibdelosporangium banguiense]